MKTLFICLTDYQILNALNIKMHLLKDKKADILFLNNKDGNIELRERLEASDIFDNVYLLDKIEINGLHKFFRNFTEGQEGEDFRVSFVNSFKELLYKFKTLFKDNEYKINQKIYGNKKIAFNCYNQIFCLDTKEIVRDCVNCVLKYTDDKCEINLLDEGVGTYLYDNILKTRFPFNNVFLYRTDLMNSDNYVNNFNLKSIPQISKNDEDFKSILNFVFYYDVEIKEWDNSIIFFDQNWDPMPKYLTNLNGIKKILLYNLYRKHLKEGSIYDMKMNLFSNLFITRYKNIIVKLHPGSSAKRFMKDYSKYSCIFTPNLKSPWELFCLNMKFKKNLWVTINSSAVTSYLFTVSDTENDLKIILLYKLVFDQDEILRQDIFFQRVKKCFPSIVFIPETILEYEKFLSEI